MKNSKFVCSIVTALIVMIFVGCSSNTGNSENNASNTIVIGGAVQEKELSLVNAVSTIAGTISSADGTGTEARLSGPSDITSDGTNLYVADKGNGTIRKIVIATSAMSTLAGTAGIFGWADGIGPQARFANIHGITTDGTNLYVADFGNNTIRKIVIDTGEVTTLAGSAYRTGSVDGKGSSARFNYPSGITTDGVNLYVTDSSNYTIRKIDIATGYVSTLAGAAGSQVIADGIGAAASFYSPNGITTDGANLYVADFYKIRKIVIATGAVTTLLDAVSNGITTDGTYIYVSQNYSICKIEISSGHFTTMAGSTILGAVDGKGDAAIFGQPQGVTIVGSNIFVVDTGNNTICKVAIGNGTVTTFAGAAEADGIGAAASFHSPHGITTDGLNLYVADFGNNTIRKIVINTGAVTTLAGSANRWGATDGIGSAATFTQPMDITTDGKNLYVVGGLTIRKIGILSGVVTTLAGSAKEWGADDGIGTSARFRAPYGITTDGINLFVTDSGAIRKIEISTGTVTTLAGTAGIYGAADGTGAAAKFSDQMMGITTDGVNLYISDSYTIRKIVISSGTVTTLAGTAGLSGATDGTGAAARFYIVKGITTDGTNLYLTTDSAIRKIVISSGVVTTLAGVARSIGSSDGTSAEARFNKPSGITTNGTNLYVADYGSNVIRAIH